ncbi:hypothetical protein CHARACLAT_029574 [Characodon lateralis]|uniref:Uncharacterized protein n=1 Tax=Characodon lateralis TaxID=208331 RepID=A0ABU7END8_9TELE|nr:hypothetical protein [Characodon lateralis]
MLMNLFPGSTMSEVMSSTKARTLRAELTETIQAWNSSSDPQSLNKTLKKMTLTETKRERDSANLSEAAQELSLCVNIKDLQKIAKALLQVEDAVESFVPDCPVLHHNRTDHTSDCPPAASTPSTSTHPPSGDPSCPGSATQT